MHSLASATGAQTNETFFEVEERARLLAAGNPCLVPEMDNELYDCCGSDAIEATCLAFGSINAALLALIILSWLVLLAKSQWFRN